MESLKNLKPLYIALLLIIAGLISPSNGVDDRTYISPILLISIVLAVLTFFSLIYILSKKIEEYKQLKKIY